MLKKFVTIKNVGRFKSFNAIGDVELKRHSLLFAENGRGKTTICTILRSLQSGVGAHVIGRTTLGSTDTPEIKILSDDSTLIFSDGAWTSTLPDIAIFDSTFVSENIFSGDLVGIGHKRNLYRVIVGRDGVTLAKTIESLDDASRTKAAEIRKKADLIQAIQLRGMTLETFLGLEKDPEVDEKLRVKESELEAFRQAEPIRTRAALSALTMPALPVGITELLGRTVEGIAEDAEAQVTAQIEAHAMHDRGQAWLSEGVGYVRDNRCPFCSQALASAAALIGAYRAFFSQGYGELRGAIAAMQRSLDDAFGDRQIASFERTVEQNVSGVEFWSRFCEIVAPGPLDSAGDRLRTLRNAAVGLLNRKAAAPLESVAADDAFTDAAAQFAMLTVAATTYNGAVATANALIDARKAATGAADIKTIEATLASLRLTKKRWEPGIKTACEEYQAAVEVKAQIEEQKTAAKIKLDKYTKTVLGKYE